MSLEIKSKSGKTIAITDTEDGNDFVIIDGKKIRLSDVYQDDKLRNEFNDEITHTIELIDE